MSWRLASLICISYIFWVKCQADDAVVPDEAHLSTESIAGGIPKISTLESSTTEIPTLESSTILESSTTKIATVATVTQSDKAHNDSLSLGKIKLLVT